MHDPAVRCDPPAGDSAADEQRRGQGRHLALNVDLQAAVGLGDRRAGADLRKEQHAAFRKAVGTPALGHPLAIEADPTLTGNRAATGVAEANSTVL